MKIISIYESSKDSKEQLKAVRPDTRNAEAGAALSCLVNLFPDRKKQTFKGFGCAITESSGYVFSKLKNDQQKEVVEACFGKGFDSNKYVMARTHMNSCDFSLENWSCVPVKDETLNSFSFERTDLYMTPLLKAVSGSGENVKCVVTPWSAPEWMKTNNDMNHGGKLKKEYYGLWAKYFVKFINGLKERGLTVEYVSVQNEPEAVQSWDSCIFTADEEAEFAVKFLRPELDKAGYENIKILCWDHNRDKLLERFTDTMKYEGADKAIAGAAYHWYSGDQYDNVAACAEKWPAKELFFTEGCIEGGARPGKWYCGERYGHNIINDLNSGCTAWLDWNMLLDIKGGPNHVGNFCDAPILADLHKKQIIFQSSYYFIGHFSRFIPAGSKIIKNEINGYMTPATVDGHIGNNMEITAALRPDGKIALVVMNRTEADMIFGLKMCSGSNQDKNFQKVYTSKVSEEDNASVFVCPPRSIQTYLIEV